jgi:integrase
VDAGEVEEDRMSVSKLPSGRWRAQCWDPRTKRNVSVAKVLGLLEPSFETKREAKAAREKARAILGVVKVGVTVSEFRERWLTDPLFERPKQSTMRHNAERSKAFAEAYGELSLTAITDRIVGEWLAGGKRNGTVPVLRAMFNDAMSAKAGRLVERNPFAKLGIRKSRGNRDVDPPSEEMVRALIAAAREHTCPAFAGWLQLAFATGMRPAEIDALRWDAVDFEGGWIYVREQYTGDFTTPKNGEIREATLTPLAREALLAQPRTGPFCFVNLRGSHWTAGSRAYHWNAVRAATGFTGTLYLATRHAAGSYMTNVLNLPAEDVAIALGHEDGGYLVKTLYGHRDKRQALERVKDAYEQRSNVVPLRAVEDSA